ncbi:hypothetical protein O5707_07200 [Escherichia coli]|nr:hypothetical protein [Escherichia coli]
MDLTVPVLTINTVSGDDIINAAEHGQALVISGSSTGGEAGDVITVTLNSKTYTTTLDASGNWSVGVPPVRRYCPWQRPANHHSYHYRRGRQQR